uniref:Uncharacterized protein n=1 Tax=Timema poppense TaxID=170557 RepID=A0A7R9DT26_TIMPO|nr:unnamed protein product [Timema poppensis]
MQLSLVAPLYTFCSSARVGGSYCC